MQYYSVKIRVNLHPTAMNTIHKLYNLGTMVLINKEVITSNQKVSCQYYGSNIYKF